MSFLGHPRCLCPALDTEVNLRTIWRRQLLPSPPLAGSQTGVQYHLGQWVVIRDSSLTIFKGVDPRMRVTRELIRGLGNAGSSLPPGVSLSYTNLLYREDFLRTFRSRFDLSSVRVDDSLHQLEGVRTEKLSRKYPGEKTTFTLRTHARMMSSHAQAHTALADCAHHPSEDKSPLRGWMGHSVPSA